MVSTRDAATVANQRTAHPEARSTLRAVAMPAEHGGWSLTAEPVLLGLLAAWSMPGLALGVAAMLVFLARTPVKVVLVDTWRHRRLPRTCLAAKVAAVEVAAIVALVVVAAVGAERSFWWPLALAAPLAAVELWFDMRSRSRRVVPELAGAVAIASVAAAIGLAGGLGDRAAVGAWCVVGARAVSAIPYVRTQLTRARMSRTPRSEKATQPAQSRTPRSEKATQPAQSRTPRSEKANDEKGAASTWPSDLTQALALVVVMVAYAADAVPLAAVVVVAAAVAWQVVMVRTTPRPAVKIGVEQTVVGLTVVLVTGLAMLAP